MTNVEKTIQRAFAPDYIIVIEWLLRHHTSSIGLMLLQEQNSEAV